MPLKKSDLYSSLWKSCDELRGGMDASQYKDYILTLLFVKYVTDKHKSDPRSLIDVPAGGSFDDMIALKGDKEIGDKINKIISKLAEANQLQKVIDLADFNDEEKLGKGKEMQDRLTKLVTIFADLDFKGSRAEGDDLLGDAYEFLMRHFATESGKSKGQFYTPAEVSRVLAKVVGIGPNTRRDQSVYDPTCGSGSLLLKVADETPTGITIYGQEKDNATWALSKMNMILHSNEDADIRKGDTITNPQFVNGTHLQTFDYAVANPPFSTKSWSNGLEYDYGIFEWGRPPEKNGDYAFLLHILKSLKSSGKAAVILPHGVLFRGNGEAHIRKQLISRGYIKGIIGLPPNLFYGTGIPACILVLDKEESSTRTHIFMVDASKGFIKDGNKNRLRSRDMHKIVDVFTNEKEVVNFSRKVPVSEISNKENDFNLNIPRYVESAEQEDIQDLFAHMHGGIPKHDIDELSNYWTAFPRLKDVLFKPSNVDGYFRLTVSRESIERTILESTEFRDFADKVNRVVAEWYQNHLQKLLAITPNTRPNALIEALSEDLLARVKQLDLLDEYDAYEQLMLYWHGTMHDDVFLIMNEGWLNASKPRITIEDKVKKISETPDLVIGTGKSVSKYKTDLIPPELIVSRYLKEEEFRIKELIDKFENATTSIETFIDENSSEDGPLSEVLVDGKTTKTLVASRLKELKSTKNTDEEAKVLQELSGLYSMEAAAKKDLKVAAEEFNVAILKHYTILNEDDVQTIVTEDKWRASIERRINARVEGLALVLVARLKELNDRYNVTLHELEDEATQLGKKVESYLRDMGVTE